MINLEGAGMELHEIIEAHRDEVVELLFAELRSSAHYRRADIEGLRLLCERLVSELSRAVRVSPHTLGDFLCAIADERLATGGNGLGELQLALNVLEHEVWRRVAVAVDDKQLLLQLLGLATGTIGSAKDRLAHRYLIAWHDALASARTSTKR
jgi:hypothetical protein